jgi:hypothetical protein
LTKHNHLRNKNVIASSDTWHESAISFNGHERRGMNSFNFRGGNESFIVLDITRCFKVSRCIPMMVMSNRIDLSRNDLQCN